ncbi:hypothetical protein FQR65_LT09288 [Abscondita terminalis]|nr:hypothetical protein FQR65_LT09288 [Abscondita terminalis]
MDKFEGEKDRKGGKKVGFVKMREDVDRVLRAELSDDYGDDEVFLLRDLGDGIKWSLRWGVLTGGGFSERCYHSWRRGVRLALNLWRRRLICCFLGCTGQNNTCNWPSALGGSCSRRFSKEMYDSKHFDAPGGSSEALTAVACRLAGAVLLHEFVLFPSHLIIIEILPRNPYLEVALDAGSSLEGRPQRGAVAASEESGCVVSAASRVGSCGISSDGGCLYISSSSSSFPSLQWQESADGQQEIG